MSESCPNCGSAQGKGLDDDEYGCGSLVRGGIASEAPACQLIRSLREELAAVRESRNNALANHVEALEQEEFWKGKYRAARDAERDRIADHLELRASKLEDELAISETSTEIGLERILAVIKSLRKEAQALRNNEHRSDT